MKFYWVLYKKERDIINPNRPLETRHIENLQELVDVHPIKWQIEMNERYNSFCLSVDKVNRVREKYTVVNWKELSEDEYNEFCETQIEFI